MSGLLMVEQKGYICTLTMNRPEKLNSINPEILKLLSDTVNRLVHEDRVRVVILRGAGEKAFSSGFDIGRIDKRIASGENIPFQEARESIRNAPFPIIAMIYGFCFGAGLQISALCDFRFASEDSQMSIPIANLGYVPSAERLFPFLNLIGIAHTKELFLTGRTISASRALDWGLVDYVLPKRELAAFTYSFAEDITQKAPLSIGGTKQIINISLNYQRINEEDAAKVRELILQAADSGDQKEAREAFFEKRKPRFEGR
ncbi:enoyl-CoA hydratase/isomerase family protein [Chloroflexota bacterium]